MKRLALLVGAVVALTLPTPSQASGWEIGLSSVAPTGDFSDVAGGGGGLHVGWSQQTNPNLLTSIQLGAIAYGGVDVGGLVEVQWYGYPLTGGASYYLNGVENGGLYIRADAGALFKLGTIEGFGEKEDESETGFVLAPGIGWDFGKLFVQADYNLGNDDWTWFAIKLGYQFGR